MIILGLPDDEEGSSAEATGNQQKPNSGRQSVPLKAYADGVFGLGMAGSMFKFLIIGIYKLTHFYGFFQCWDPTLE